MHRDAGDLTVLDLDFTAVQPMPRLILDALYDAARVRLLLARACNALSDTDGATRALDAAAEV